jgi:hypothetical protein
VKSVAVAAVVLLLSTACAYFSPPLEQRTSRGPTARQFWTLRMMMANGREPNIEDRRHWQDEIDQKIAQYLRENPDAANSLDLSSFRFDKQVVTGMSKQQVLILLGPPEAVTSDQAQMQALARRYWQGIEGNATEVWVYDLGWRMFFSGTRLVTMTQYLERD